MLGIRIQSAAMALAGVWLAFAMLPARAQGGPPMLTDDPGTPGDGKWEINIAALLDHAGDTTTFQLPLIDLNYGAGERVQITLQAPWLLVQQAGMRDQHGIGNSQFAVKWRFFDAGEDGWKISTFPRLESRFPVGASTLADPGVSYLLPFEFTHALGGDWGVNFEFGRWLRPAPREDTWIAGVVLGRKFGETFELMAELHDERDVHSARNESALNFGATWDISQRCTLLVSAGTDLHNGFDSRSTVLTYVGIQLHL